MRNPMKCGTGRAAIVIPLLLPAAAFAAGMPATPLPSEGYYLAQMPVVLSATRLAQPENDAPAAVTVIDRQMIQASGARDLADLFRLVPGMQVGFVNGNTPTVTYHGLGDQLSRRIQVLVDGRSVYIPSFGGVPWSDLPLAIDDIDRIEVIRGPNAATYGANSFLAVISITTRHPAEEQGDKVTVRLGDDRINDHEWHHGGSHGNLDYRFTLGFKQDQGYAGGVTDGQYVTQYDNRRVPLFTGRADYRAGNNDTLMFQMGFSEPTRGTGQIGSAEGPPHVIRDRASFQQMRWDRTLEGGGDLSLQFYHDYNIVTEHELEGPFPQYGGIYIPFIYDSRTERYDLELQHSFRQSPALRWVWGASARLDRVTSPFYFSSNNWFHNHLQRVFGNAEWRVAPRVLVNAGTMYEHNDLTGGELSPRLAVNFQATRHHMFRAAISRATRTPVLFEDYGKASITASIPGVGNLVLPVFAASGHLQPERILSREVGYLGTFMHRQMMVDVKLYHDVISDLITIYIPQVPGGGFVPKDFHNANRVTEDGIETQLVYRPDPDTQIRLSHAYINIDSTDTQENYAATAPFNSVQLFASHMFPHHLELSGAFNFDSAMMWGGEGETTGPVRRLDLRAAKSYVFGNTTLTTALVVQNALGKYMEFRKGNFFPRRIYVQFSLSHR